VSQPARLRRQDVYRTPVVDGRRADAPTARLRRRLQRLLVSTGEREEAELERLLAQQSAVSRANVVAVISPKGGVGKTTSAFVAGSLLADRLRLRAIAVDANPDFGTLAALAPDRLRCERSLADLLSDIERVEAAAQLRSYVSALPSGLHLLGAPRDAEVMAGLGPEAYGELLALLATFYELVLLDLGTGVAGELAQFAIGRADQVVLVTTPEWITSCVVLEALAHLSHDHTTVAINKSLVRSPAIERLEERFRAEHLHRAVTIPYDEQLAVMLDSGAYTLEALQRPTRVAVKRLGLAVAEQLV
jgi:MinD-like ATPase involved in chromosome partitioning or flagellar assembly